MSEKSEHESGSDAVDVSIIVVAWNVRRLLNDCLKSVFDETKGIRYEVIYVDNASEDGSVEMVRKEFPEVGIIENEKNEGFIKANNQAIEISRGRYVLLLNSDTVILDNAIAKTVEFADLHPDAAATGCKVLNTDGSLQRDCFMYPSLLNMFLSAFYLSQIFPKSRFFGRERMTWWDYEDVRQVQTISGCYSMVRMEAIKQVGVMDEAYFFYGDDIDWCYRFIKGGWKIMYTPGATIIHHGHQNTKHQPQKFKLQLFGSILIFMKLHRSWLEFILACILVALTFFLRVPFWVVKAIVGKEQRKYAIQTAWTYLKGGFHCLVDWKKLLMDREVLNERLKRGIALAGT